jgi:hypothetical protein
MEKHRRATDGRRLFTAEFKREQLGRVERREVTLEELARDLSISPSVGADETRKPPSPRDGAEELFEAIELRTQSDIVR